jgi:hypothetical protein
LKAPGAHASTRFAFRCGCVFGRVAMGIRAGGIDEGAGGVTFFLPSKNLGSGIHSLSHKTGTSLGGGTPSSRERIKIIPGWIFSVGLYFFLRSRPGDQRLGLGPLPRHHFALCDSRLPSLFQTRFRSLQVPHDSTTDSERRRKAMAASDRA